MARRAPLIFFVVLFSLGASACAAILGIDEVTIKDGGALIDASGADAVSAGDGGTWCQQNAKTADLCADFDESSLNNAYVSGALVGVFTASNSADAATTLVAADASLPNGFLASTNPIADDAGAIAWLYGTVAKPGTTFKFSYDVFLPQEIKPSFDGDLTFAYFALNAPDGGGPTFETDYELASASAQGARVALVDNAFAPGAAFTYAATNPITVGRWVNLRFNVRLDAVNANVSFYVDDVLQFPEKVIPTGRRAPAIASLTLGLTSRYNLTPAATVIYDNVTLEIDPTSIAIPDGG